MSVETSFILLFSVATAVAIAVRRLRIPYTVALVIVGLILGSVHALQAPHLTKDLLFALILPGLVFEAAFNLDVKEFSRNRLAIGSLAVPGVIVAIALTAVIVVPVLDGFGIDDDFDWRYGLVFGALIAATDPIAVVALFKRLHVPHRLSVLVEAESLLNDGTAVVFFTLILAFVGGAAASFGSLIGQFAFIVGGGAVAGAVLGIAATQITRRIDEPVIEITLTVIAAYGSFVLAEQFHCSGVIATVVAGMLCGSYGRRVGMSPTTRLAVETFWQYAAFALNSIVFLLIGFEVEFSALLSSWREIVVAYVAALIARAGVVAAVTTALRMTGETLPRGWNAVLTWGGLRGALSMVLALALPAEFPHRQQLITMTFGVVLVSLLVQGLSMSWLLRRLGLIQHDDRAFDVDSARGRLQIADTALTELAHMERNRGAPSEVIASIRARYEERRAIAERDVATLHAEGSDSRRDAAVRAMRHLLFVERAHLTDASNAGVLRADVARHLMADVDARLAKLNAGAFGEPLDLVATRFDTPSS
jgi:monovalent cation:H+ antiporter, CPA1 family